jgi:hypothetical protein
VSRLRTAMPAALLLLAAACGGVASQGGARSPDRDRAQPESSPLPTVAHVVCAEDGTRVVTPKIEPQRDGAHVMFDNGTEERRLITWVHGGEGVDPGRTELVFDIPPDPRP